MQINYTRSFPWDGESQIRDIIFRDANRSHMVLLILPVPELIINEIKRLLEENVPHLSPSKYPFDMKLEVRTDFNNKNSLIDALIPLKNNNYITNGYFEQIKTFVDNYNYDFELSLLNQFRTNQLRNIAFGRLTSFFRSTQRAPMFRPLVPPTQSNINFSLRNNLFKKVDYYAILEISKDASVAQIKSAYRKLAKVKHPDKSNSESAHAEFSLLQEAYHALLADAEKRSAYDFEYQFQTQPLRITLPYLNQKTLYLESVDDIDPNKLIVLDHYAFDIDELVDYAKADLHNLYKNPHITDQNQNSAFSTNAKNKMKTYPQLRPYLLELENRLMSQSHGIKAQTVDAFMVMLNKLNRDGVAGSTDAMAAFLEHTHTLSEQEQQQLNSFIIEAPSITGGFQRLRFDHALIGSQALNGNEGQCIGTAQVFGWQFVVMVRPAAITQVPQAVKDQAHSIFLKIEAPAEVTSNTQPSFHQNRQSASTHIRGRSISRSFLNEASLRDIMQTLSNGQPNVNMIANGRPVGAFTTLAAFRSQVGRVSSIRSLLEANLLRHQEDILRNEEKEEDELMRPSRR